MADEEKPDMDEPVKIDLDPEEALKALLATGPHPKPAEDDPEPPQGDPLAN